MFRQSQIYKCPKCGNPVRIQSTFESDEYGDRIEVEATCPNCKDTRYDTIDEMTYNFAGLVAKIGT